ncbi:MAG: TIGR03085 family protein [Actinobacteria bacterium]|nr:MAG: TIGR03085 family protein [Actinomycetota bacterium]
MAGPSRAGYAQAERAALITLLCADGPDAPTLIEGWRTRDLAAHLIARDRRPDILPGLRLSRFAGHTERVRRAVADQPYGRILDQLRHPPWWGLFNNRVADALINTLEYYLHHEDVRRGVPDWQPRELPAAQQAALWRPASLLARLRLRRFPAALTITAPGHGTVTTGAGGEPLRLVGTPGELVIFLSGRQRAAQVQLDGPPPLAERLRTAPLNL